MTGSSSPGQQGELHSIKPPTPGRESIRKLRNNLYQKRYNYQTGAISEDVAEQTEQIMRNIADALDKAGAAVRDIVRVRYILPDRNLFPETWPILQKWLADVRPAATMIQAGLMEDVMKIEIEVTARMPGRPETVGGSSIL